jgi:predicted amidophosphoribosyltransferase
MAVIKYIRSCFYCSSGERIESGLCTICWKTLESKKQVREITPKIESALTGYYLFSWEKDKSPLLNATMVLQKNPESFEMHLRFAEWLSYGQPYQNNLCFIPIPSTTLGQKDHAYWLAHNLAKIWQAPMGNILKWKHKPGLKKEQSRTDRRVGLIELVSEEFLKTHKNRKLILIDDIVTTGSTVRLAYEALRTPDKIEIWAIACRQNSFLV